MPYKTLPEKGRPLGTGVAPHPRVPSSARPAGAELELPRPGAKDNRWRELPVYPKTIDAESGESGTSRLQEKVLALVHDERFGNQPLFGGIHRQGQTVKSVGTQLGWSIVLSEDHKGDHALTVYRRRRLSIVQINPPPIGQRDPVFAPRLNPQLAQQAGGQCGVRRPRCPPSLQCLGPFGRPCWNSEAAT